MPSPITPLAERTALSQPTGPDNVNRSFLMSLIQGVANRGEWNAKKLVDVQHAVTTAATTSVTSTTFVDAGALASLTFTEVEVGDIIVLHAALSVTCTAVNGIGARWLVGAVDATLAAGEYPKVVWGTASTDRRSLAVPNVHAPAAAAASLVAKVQYRADSGSGGAITVPYAQIIGVHFRLGAA